MVVKWHYPKVLALGVLLLCVGAAQAEETLKPFVLASVAAGEVDAVAAEVKQKLQAAGFEVAGAYSPYADAQVIVVTSEALKQNAAQSQFGGYGAVQRVSVTKVKDEVQVAYTNPVYMAAAYRMQGDLAAVGVQLATALGKKNEFGPEEGLSAKKLNKYHYMVGMEYFDEPSTLAEFPSYDDAVKAVEAGLAANDGGVSKVYRVDVPGKQESVFGVKLTKECSGDEYIMNYIDFKPTRSTAHLPYEMLVSGGKVYALYARFRIAINFPDLKMMGANSFMKIMCAPKAIKQALISASGQAQAQ